MPSATTEQVLALAIQHQHAGRLSEAEQLYRQILAREPDHADALHMLGTLAVQVGRVDIGIDLIARAISLRADNARADNARAYNDLGVALKKQGRLDEAIASYRRAVELAPNFAEAHSNLGNALSAQGDLNQAIAFSERAVKARPDDPRLHSNLIYLMHFHSGFDSAAILAAHQCWGRQHARPMLAELPTQTWPNEPAPEKRLRVGYVSPDFRNHAVGRFLVGLFENYDHDRFQCVCFSGVRQDDGLTQKLRACAHEWHSTVGLSDDAMAKLIREKRIDLLVDLSLHMAGNRMMVFARKPAPVQVTYLAYPGTSGMAAMDYRLTDPYLDPPGINDHFYTERSVRLKSYWCYRPLGPQADVGPLPARNAGFITFGCLNNFAKVSDAALNVWIKLLRIVRDSRFLLHAPEGQHRDRIRQNLAENGAGESRIEFADKQNFADYMSTYHRIDIALDPFTYNGGTTTCDAMWMGVPVVTLAGKLGVGRAGVSLLTQVGLTDLIASNAEEYVRIAASLANDLPRLQHLRSTMRQRMQQSPLMDAEGFTRDVENAYRTMWKNWCTTR